MKLYYKPGACSLAPHIVLRELGSMFDLERVDTVTGMTETGADYDTINPNGYVPALQLESGEIITENPAMLQYLAEDVGTGNLMPEDNGIVRVRLREVLNFISAELHKAFGPFFSGRELSDGEREAGIRNVSGRIEHIERLLFENGDYLTGDTYSIADAYAFVVLNWTNVIGLTLDPWPLTKAYVERIQARSAVKSAMRAEGLIPS